MTRNTYCSSYKTIVLDFYNDCMHENETSTYLCDLFRVDGDASSKGAERDTWRNTLGKVYYSELCFIQICNLCNPYQRRPYEHARSARRAGSSAPSEHTTDTVNRGRWHGQQKTNICINALVALMMLGQNRLTSNDLDNV